MKLTYFAGLAIVPLAFAIGEKEESHVENTFLDVNLTESAIIVEDTIGALAHSLAKDVDATLAMDAKQHGSDVPVSIDSIVKLLFVDKKDTNTALGDAFYVSKDNLMREITRDEKYIALGAEKEETMVDEEQKEVTISEEDKNVLSKLHDELLNGLHNIMSDYINATKNGIVGIIDQVDIRSLFTSFTQIRPVYETAFTGYGSGDSPIERMINIFESSVKEFNKNLLALETDINEESIQELANGQVETILTSLRTEIGPLVEQHMRFQNAPEEGDGTNADPDFNIINILNAILQYVWEILEYILGSLLGLVQGFLEQNDPQGKILQNGDMRFYLVKTLEQVSDSFVSLIKGHVRASYFMMNVLTRAADTYSILDTHLNALVTKSMNSIDGGLYALLNDDVQLRKLTNALIRNVKPLSVHIATTFHSFVTYNLNTLRETSPVRSFLFNPMELVFGVLKNWTTNIKAQNGFLGVILEALVGVVVSIFSEDGNGNYPLMPSLEDTIHATEFIINALIGTTSLATLFF